MNKLKEKKLNNKGFSLVELIIVIAIMAVLIGVLAPQYLKYVEKSRESADLDNYRAMITAVQVYFSDPAHTAKAGTISVDGNGKVTPSTDIAPALTDAGVNAGEITMKSKKYVSQTLTFTVGSDGAYTITATGDLASGLGITATGTP